MSAVIHKPELGGAKARYCRADVDPKVFGDPHWLEREVVGWDRQGHALVAADDELFRAAGAPYAKYTQFVCIVSPDPIEMMIWGDGDDRRTTLMQILKDHISDMYWGFDVEDTFKEVLRDVLREELAARRRKDNQ
jgi:hypothetical protein